MHRFEIYQNSRFHCVAALGVACMLLLAIGTQPARAQNDPARAQDDYAPTHTGDDHAPTHTGQEPTDTGRVPTDSLLVSSGEVVPLDGTYRILMAGAYAADDVSAAGDSLDLRTLRGKYVLLDFWASWCAPCIEEMPDLNEFASEFGGRDDFVFISVNQDALTSGGDMEYVKQLVLERAIEYPVLIDDREPSLKKAFSIRAWPTRVLIHPDGERLRSRRGRLTIDDVAGHLRAVNR